VAPLTGAPARIQGAIRKRAGIAAAVGGQARSGEEIALKSGIEAPAHFAQRGGVVFVDQAAAVGRNIEQQHAVATDRTIPDIDQLFRALDLPVLVGMIEPARADRDVGLGGIPDQPAGLPDLFATAEILPRAVAGHEGPVGGLLL